MCRRATANAKSAGFITLKMKNGRARKKLAKKLERLVPKNAQFAKRQQAFFVYNRERKRKKRRKDVNDFASINNTYKP